MSSPGRGTWPTIDRRRVISEAHFPAPVPVAGRGVGAGTGRAGAGPCGGDGRAVDRSGAAAEIFTLAADLGVNIANFEVSHSVEGDRGILVLIIDKASAEMFRGGLMARKFRPSIQTVA